MVNKILKKIQYIFNNVYLPYDVDIIINEAYLVLILVFHLLLPL